MNINTKAESFSRGSSIAVGTSDKNIFSAIERDNKNKTRGDTKASVHGIGRCSFAFDTKWISCRGTERNCDNDIAVSGRLPENYNRRVFGPAEHAAFHRLAVLIGRIISQTRDSNNPISLDSALYLIRYCCWIIGIIVFSIMSYRCCGIVYHCRSWYVRETGELSNAESSKYPAGKARPDEFITF